MTGARPRTADPRRRTVGRPVTIRGAGLLSRRRAEVTLRPGPAGEGIIFNERIKATPAQASVREHTTCLGRGVSRISAVEHLMAACAGLGVTDLAVEVSGGELPFGDGSGLPYFRALERAGVIEREEEAAPLVPSVPILVQDNAGFIYASPSSRLRVTFAGSPPRYRGPWDVSSEVTCEVFRTRIAGARTYGVLKERLAVFRRRHRLRFRLVRRAGGVYPEKERMAAEPLRHKTLDLLGDLWLLGRPVCLDIRAAMSGHRLNLMLARRLEEECPS